MYDFVTNQPTENPSTISLILSLLLIIPSIWLTVNFIKEVFSIYDNHVANIKDLFVWDNKSLAKIFKYFVTSILISIIGGIPIIISVISLNFNLISNYFGIALNIIFASLGVYLYTKLSFAPFFIIDKNTDIFESLNKSWKITKNHILKLILMYILFIVLIILGFIALIIPGIIIIYIFMFSSVHVYRVLYSKTFSE